AVDAEARTELHLFADDTGVETVERPHRGAPHAAAEQVVDAAVAWADEALGRVDPAHGAAEVRAAAGDRYVRRAPVVGVGVDFRVVPAHVDGRLARLADSGRERQGDGHVVGGREGAHAANRLPVV